MKTNQIRTAMIMDCFKSWMGGDECNLPSARLGSRQGSGPKVGVRQSLTGLAALFVVVLSGCMHPQARQLQVGITKGVFLTVDERTALEREAAKLRPVLYNPPKARPGYGPRANWVFYLEPNAKVAQESTLYLPDVAVLAGGQPSLSKDLPDLLAKILKKADLFGEVVRSDSGGALVIEASYAPLAGGRGNQLEGRIILGGKRVGAFQISIETPTHGGEWLVGMMAVGGPIAGTVAGVIMANTAGKVEDAVFPLAPAAVAKEAATMLAAIKKGQKSGAVCSHPESFTDDNFVK